MKAALSALGVCVIVVVFAAITIIELLIRLAPLLVALAIGSALVAATRARRRRQADDVRLIQLWAHQPTPSPPPIEPAPAPRRPPATGHRHHTCLVVGHDSGFTLPQHNGFLDVSAEALPAAAAPPRPLKPRTVRHAHRSRRGRTRP